MAELADQQTDNSGVVAESIPPTPADTGIEETRAINTGKAAPEGDAPKKLSLREQLTENIEKSKQDERGRLHARDGKFVPKDKKPVETAPGKEPTTKEAPPEAPKAIGPPPGWSAESKAYFNSLPPDHPLRRDVAKREDEVSSGFKKYSEIDKRHQEIEQVLAPVRQTYQQAGIQSDAEAIKRLFMWEGQFRNPATRNQAFQQLAQQYGVNLNSPTSEPSMAQDIPPALKPIVDGYGNVTQQLSAIQSDLQRRDQTAAQEQLAQFAKDKPHYEKVKTNMGQLMLAAANAGQNLSLSDAYEQAIWGNPEIREQLTKEQIAKAFADSEAANTQRVQHAKQTAISPSGRAPSAPVKDGNKKMNGVRGSILAAVDEIRERA